MRRLLLKNSGDTIVEVLISIALVSVILVGAYASATHSVNNSRQSQERAEALKVAEAQLEKIKTYATVNPTITFYSTAAYCFDNSGAGTVKKFAPPDLSPAYDPFVALSADDFTKYPGGCNFQNLYNVAIKYSPPTSPGPPASTDDYFTLEVRWDRLGGGKDQIVMSYRLHQ